MQISELRVLNARHHIRTVLQEEIVRPFTQPLSSQLSDHIGADGLDHLLLTGSRRRTAELRKLRVSPRQQGKGQQAAMRPLVIRGVPAVEQVDHVFQANAKNALKQSRTVTSVLICAGTGCIAGGSLKIYDNIKAECESRGIAVYVGLKHDSDAEKSLHVKMSGCHGFCEMGPLVHIEPLGIMEMFAAVLRDQYREKDAADGRETYHIALMPCTAKKMEAARPEFSHVQLNKYLRYDLVKIS